MLLSLGTAGLPLVQCNPPHKVLKLRSRHHSITHTATALATSSFEQLYWTMGSSKPLPGSQTS